METEMNEDSGYELPVFALVCALIVLLLVCAFASAKDLTFPVKEDGCGTLGNVIAAAQDMRNHGMSLEDAKKVFQNASDSCVKDNGKDKCILQDEAGKTMFSDMLDSIWSSPPIDPTVFGFDVYQHCIQANKGKES
jgi:hypothetical protein